MEGAPGREAGTPETPGRVQPHSLLRESVTGRRASQALAFFTGSGPFFLGAVSFTGTRPASQAPGLFRNAIASQALALLHRLRAFSVMR